jgi:serine/threonine protein kinase
MQNNEIIIACYYFLHFNHIMRRDINPSNILFDEEID